MAAGPRERTARRWDSASGGAVTRSSPSSTPSNPRLSHATRVRAMPPAAVLTPEAETAASRSSTTALSASAQPPKKALNQSRSEEHTSELQSRFDLVCRLLLEKKKH